MNPVVEWMGGAAVMGGTGGVAFFAFKWAVDWLTRRHDARQARLDAQDERLDQGWKAYRETLERKLGEHERQIAALRYAFDVVSRGLIEVRPDHPALAEAAQLMRVAFPVDFSLDTALAEVTLRRQGREG